MATITKTQASFENGLCQWSYDYDDVTLKLLTFRCNNDTVFSSEGKVRTVSADGTTFGSWFSKVVTPGEHWSTAIPQAVQDMFNIGVDARGRLTGIDASYRMLGA